jgi:hypothetical protein
MFEITGDDIALLNDERLREVIGRLCEAELRQRGLSPAHVTWGGNQNAPDGGIDVRVALPAGIAIDGFIPRAATGFQVKQEDMPPGKVGEEMRPKSVLRPSIQALADQAGAYIIVSSQGSTADTPLTSRRGAMRAAVQGEPNADALLLDFYDRTRIAAWVRTHEGLIPRVRELIGKSIPGWRSYGSWATPPEPLTAEYLLDNKLRIHASKHQTQAGVSALEGITQLRNELRIPRNVVRLIGLSGIGKTRLVQALFDDRIGEQCLDPAIAIYTDFAVGPNPQPVALATDLVAGQTRAILVIDNCKPELHQRLSDVCRQPQSNVSVITVEYDIRDDEPEGTEVFRLDTSSRELIEKLLQRRFPALSQVDGRTIAEFSGGNASIAIALAARIDHNETVAGLNDEQLFQRLFEQRHTPDQSLYRAAQACSLVYSFEGENLSDGDDAEMICISDLVGITPQALYGHIADLKERDLVQQRGVWRAVLPHAVANRLAALALKTIPYTAIDQQLLQTPSGRLMKSFARRLGYLHASKEAVKIVTQWLGSGGLLEDVANFNEIERGMFQSIAPVAPDAVLAALERTCAQDPLVCEQYVDLVRSLAYEPAYFERCIELLVLIVAAGKDDERSHGREVFASLFHLCLSGTHATIEQRLTVLESLLGAADVKRRALGALGLRAVLEAWHFMSVSEFDFGARSRDFGYWPRTFEEVRHWFAAVLNLIERLACGNTAVTSQVRAALAEKFRGVWNRVDVRAELVALSQRVNETQFWPEGWLAIRQTLDFGGKGMPQDQLKQLRALEQALRPTDLVNKVRSIVLSTRHHGVDLDDFEDHTSDDISTRMDRTEALARDLGTAVATDEAALSALLPELVSNDGRLWSFGEGLYAGAAEPVHFWDRLVTVLAGTEERMRKPQILCGFLHAAHAQHPALVDSLLDQSLEHETLATWYPFLQLAVPIDEKSVQRLKQSLASGKTPVGMFSYLTLGRATDPIAAPDLRDLLLAIAATPNGYDVAVEILYMRLHSDRDKKQGILPEVVTAGCELLQQLPFTKHDREDHRIGEIAKSCLKGDQGVGVVQELCGRLKAAVEKYETYVFHHDDLLQGIFLAQPIATLEALCGGNVDELNRGVRMLRDVGFRKRPLAVVLDKDLLRWCEEEPETRYVAMAGVITSFEPQKGSGPRWTGLALQFLERAPNRVAVLSQFTAHFLPSGGWSGSLASIMEANATLLDQLDAFPGLQTAIAQEKARVQQWIAKERSRESLSDRERNERFE